MTAFSYSTFRHEIALTYIVKAIEELRKYEDFRFSDEVGEKQAKQRVQILATAYHNCAVEYEYIKLYSDALFNYD